MSAKEQLYGAHRDASEKYTYFLLAGAGAAIAFAVTQSQTATLSWSKLPLAAAVVCWGISFYFGCRQVQTRASLMFQNFQMLRVRDGEHPEFPPNPAVINVIRKILEEQSNKSGASGAWQFRFLIGGAFFYVVWHVTEMALRTPGLLARLGL
jgi:hypothetical protein